MTLSKINLTLWLTSFKYTFLLVPFFCRSGFFVGVLLSFCPNPNFHSE